jgi:hypothetical protein
VQRTVRGGWWVQCIVGAGHHHVCSVSCVRRAAGAAHAVCACIVCRVLCIVCSGWWWVSRVAYQVWGMVGEVYGRCSVTRGQCTVRCAGYYVWRVVGAVYGLCVCTVYRV